MEPLFASLTLPRLARTSEGFPAGGAGGQAVLVPLHPMNIGAGAGVDEGVALAASLSQTRVQTCGADRTDNRGQGGPGSFWQDSNLKLRLCRLCWQY